MARMLLALLWVLPGAEPVDTLVVCPADLRAALNSWVEYRTAQGHRIKIVEPADSAESTLHRVRAAGTRSVRFVVLIGDADRPSALVRAPTPGSSDRSEPIAPEENYSSRRLRSSHAQTPAHYFPAEVNVHFGSEPTIVTDAPYGDFDGDGRPDTAVGRISVENADQLRTVLEKTIAYERSTDWGLWRRQIHCIGGVGGFGPLLDGVITQSVRFFLTETIPPAYHVTMTYASEQSPYCPSLYAFPEHARARYNEGGWFWVYLGHGRPDGLDWVRTRFGNRPILDCSDVAQLQPAVGRPLVVLFSCYGTAFDADDCLGEELLRSRGGPAAVIGASRVSMPYGMASLAVGLLDAVFARQSPTVGEALLLARRELTDTEQSDDPRRRLLDAIAGGFSPSRDALHAECAEHAAMFHLLGDPLLRLRYPLKLPLEAKISPGAEGRLVVNGFAPCSGRLRLEASPRRGRIPQSMAAVTTDTLSPEATAIAQPLYQRANASGRLLYESPLAAGRFTLDLPLPQPNEPHIVGYLQGSDNFAVGSALWEPAPSTARTNSVHR